VKLAYRNPLLQHERDAVLTEILSQRGMLTHLSKELGITKASISAWKHVPLHHVKAISKLLSIPQRRLINARVEE
jgi:hypothetical protein